MHNLPIVVAGKTGTSQVTSIPQSTVNRLKEHELAYFHRSHAWITTYAPFKDPQFVVTVLVEHGGHGGSTSAPIAADIYKWLYEKGYFAQNAEGTTVNTDIGLDDNTSTDAEATNNPRHDSRHNDENVKHEKPKKLLNSISDLF